MKKYIFTSVVLHFLAILLIFNFKIKHQSNIKMTESENVTARIIDTPMDEDTGAPNSTLRGGDQYQSLEKGCDSLYGGIGVEINLKNGQVTEIYHGYSASKAKVMVGDILIPLNAKDIRGKIGSSVKLKIIRKNKQFIINVIRDKICFKNTK